MTINRACIVLWIVLFTIGLWLSMHKPLWCDELYGQSITIEESSWGKLLTGKHNNEGNNFPLYFVIQKAMMSVVNLDLPVDLKKDFDLPELKRKYLLLVHPKGQIFLRILPNVLMTTAIIILVHFFWLRGGIVVGLVALLSALSSGMVWEYWVEARPYPLWFLLTIVQALFLIDIISKESPCKRAKSYLTVSNWLLVVSVPLGFVQVIISQVILFIFGQRDLKYFILAGILPTCSALFFLSNRSSNSLYIAKNPIDIFMQNISLEQAVLLFFYLLAFFCYRSWGSNNEEVKSASWKGLIYLLNLLIGLGLFVAVLVYVSYRWAGKHDGFPIFSRHFIFLSALGLVMIPAMFSDLWSRCRGRTFWKWIFLAVFVVLLLDQLIEGVTYAWSSGFYF